jgi:hypothetical protein
MQVKGDRCGECAYDPVCGGVYAPYADLHGLSELIPLGVRKPPPPTRTRRMPDTPLSQALRRVFVTPDSAPSQAGVRDVRRLPDGSHELVCVAGGREWSVNVAPRSEAPAYARTERFSVTYKVPPDGARPDERLLRAIVKRLQLAEQGMHRSPPAPPPHDLGPAPDEG